MRWPRNSETSSFRFLSSALVLAWSISFALAQQNQIYGGVIEDWTHHHVVFSNPGSLVDAIRNGRRAEWENIIGDPRYRLQWIKRYATPPEWHATDQFHPRHPAPDPPNPLPPRIFKVENKRVHADWNFSLGIGDHGVAIDMYPAKYTFSPVGSPDCVNDFVVFPINSPGGSTQASVIGVNNLYSGTCTGSVPAALFSYDVGSGDVQTSPVLSLDGTKVAFVESIVGGSYFHLLTIDKSGNSGCPNSSPCNGTDYNHPVTPGINNSAVDKKILMRGGVSVSSSSPFVDYSRDVAYVGDDSGTLHKFTGVFLGTPAEVTTSPWPFTVSNGVILTGPVFDGGASQNIFVGGGDGNLYCVTFAGTACSTPSVSVAAGTSPGPVVDEPIVGDHGFSLGTPNCANDTCIMSFALPTSAPFTFPTAANATGTNATLNLGNHGISGNIIDNVSGAAGHRRYISPIFSRARLCRPRKLNFDELR